MERKKMYRVVEDLDTPETLEAELNELAEDGYEIDSIIQPARAEDVTFFAQVIMRLTNKARLEETKNAEARHRRLTSSDLEPTMSFVTETANALGIVKVTVHGSLDVAIKQAKHSGFHAKHHETGWACYSPDQIARLASGATEAHAWKRAYEDGKLPIKPPVRGEDDDLN